MRNTNLHKGNEKKTRRKQMERGDMRISRKDEDT